MNFRKLLIIGWLPFLNACNSNRPEAPRLQIDDPGKNAVVHLVPGFKLKQQYEYKLNKMAFQDLPAEATIVDGKIIHNVGNVAGQYRIRVKAGTNRPAGAIASGAFTITNLTPLAAPTYFAVDTDPTGFNFIWSAVTNNNGYVIDGSTDGVNWNQLVTPALNTTTAAATGFNATAFRFFRLKAKGNNTTTGDSPYSIYINNMFIYTGNPVNATLGSNLQNVSVAGSNVTYTGPATLGAWGGSATADQVVNANGGGYIEATTPGEGKRVGLVLDDIPQPTASASPQSPTYNQLNYFMFQAEGTYSAFTDAGNTATGFTWMPGDIMRVERVGNRVYYKVARAANPTYFTVIGSKTAISGTLYGKALFDETGGFLNNIKIAIEGGSPAVDDYALVVTGNSLMSNTYAGFMPQYITSLNSALSAAGKSGTVSTSANTAVNGQRLAGAGGMIATFNTQVAGRYVANKRNILVFHEWINELSEQVNVGEAGAAQRTYDLAKQWIALARADNPNWIILTGQPTKRTNAGTPQPAYENQRQALITLINNGFNSQDLAVNAVARVGEDSRLNTPGPNTDGTASSYFLDWVHPNATGRDTVFVPYFRDAALFGLFGTPQPAPCTTPVTTTSTRANTASFVTTGTWNKLPEDGGDAFTQIFGSYGTFTFTGIRLRVFGKYATGFDVIRLTLDGGTPVTVDTGALTTGANQLFYDFNNLTPGQHTIRVEKHQNDAQYIVINSFEVTS